MNKFYYKELNSPDGDVVFASFDRDEPLFATPLQFYKLGSSTNTLAATTYVKLSAGFTTAYKSFILG